MGILDKNNAAIYCTFKEWCYIVYTNGVLATGPLSQGGPYNPLTTGVQPL